MKSKLIKPSYFAKIFPWDSVFKKSEYERVAQNIMIILKRTGDVFRELSYEEYVSKRLKDGNYSNNEKKYFDEVIKYCVSAEAAKRFSKMWDFSVEYKYT